MLSKVIYDVGVLVVLVDVEALLPVDWGDAGGLSRLKVSPHITGFGT